MLSRECALSCCGMQWDFHRSWIPQKKKTKNGGWEWTFALKPQYVSEIRLEYDDGLQKYEDFIEEQVTENDAFIGPYTHTIFLNVYHPELHYYLLGYKLYSLPFVNTEALTNYSQLETYDNLWYICFQGGVPNEVEGEYRYEEAVKFHYMYYDFVVYRLERIVQE